MRTKKEKIVSYSIGLLSAILVCGIALFDNVTITLADDTIETEPTTIETTVIETTQETTIATEPTEITVETTEETSPFASEVAEMNIWFGIEINGPQKKHITVQSGVFNGPSGRETFYNLPMKGVISHMRKLGYSAEDFPYWVRDDGCKMLGPYIMVAANIKTRPYGTILETSMGTAIVCDTGEFVKKYPKGIDIAVNWKT